MTLLQSIDTTSTCVSRLRSPVALNWWTMRHFSDHIPVCIFFHSEAGEAGEGDMKDIDDIYDMENYDNDDSPGVYVVVISRARGMYSVWYLLHQSPRAINAIIPCIPSARDITSSYPVGIAT